VSEPEQPTDYLRGYLRLRPGAAVYEISSDELQISFPNYTVTYTSPVVTAGVLARTDAGGKSRKSLLINIDALRLLKPDVAPQAVRQAQSIAGEVLDRLPPR